jgi:hypothetical protein
VSIWTNERGNHGKVTLKAVITETIGIPCQVFEILKAATKRTTGFRSITENHVSCNRYSIMPISEVQCVFLTRVNDVVRQDHIAPRVPGPATKRVRRVDQRIVNDLHIDRFSLMIGARESRVSVINQKVVANDRFSLNLHNAVQTAVTNIEFDHILWLAARAVNGDTRINALVHPVLSDQISPGTLFNLNAISLTSTAVVNMIQSNDALAHNHVAVVSPEIHSCCGPISIVDCVACQIKLMRIG